VRGQTKHYYWNKLAELHAHTRSMISFSEGRDTYDEASIPFDPVMIMALHEAVKCKSPPEAVPLVQKILAQNFELMGMSIQMLHEVEEFVLNSFDLPELKIEYDVGVYPLGEVNAVCSELSENESYFLLIDPGMFDMIEIVAKTAMMLSSDRNQYTLDQVCSFFYEYFLDTLDERVTAFPSFLAGAPDPVKLVADDALVNQFSVVARRALDFCLYHEWGHIWSKHLPMDHPVSYMKHYRDGEAEMAESNDSVNWANELWADRIACVALAAQLRDMETAERNAYLEVTLAGIALFLSFNAFLEHYYGDDQTELIETEYGVIYSVHPIRKHPPSFMRLGYVMDYFGASFDLDEHLVDLTGYYMAMFTKAWRRAEEIPAGTRAQHWAELAKSSSK